MSKNLLATIIITTVLVVGYFSINNNNNSKTVPSPSLQDTKISSSNFSNPVDRATERITKKPFGIKVSPANSPVQPEKFSGYHTGVDFETFPEEQNIDVPIYAICDGQLVLKKIATGYGGVVVEQCELIGQPINLWSS